MGSDKKSKNFPISISILESTLYNKQLSEGLSITLYSLGNTTGETSANIEEFMSVNEYGACDRYDFTETDKTAGYQPESLSLIASSLISLGEVISVTSTILIHTHKLFNIISSVPAADECTASSPTAQLLKLRKQNINFRQLFY